jgi:hypothetical protein
MDNSLVDALIGALERKAEKLRKAERVQRDSAESGVREALADWIDELIEQFQEGEIDL